jgi:galactonate dehydratase
MIAAAQPDLPSASAGRIVRVTAYPLRARLPITQRTGQGDWSFIEIVVVEVETDQGLIGIGECLARKGACAYARFINLMFAPLLLGQDPLDRRRHWAALRSILSGRAGGMMIENVPVGVTSMIRATGYSAVLLSSGHSRVVSAVSASGR